MPDSEPFPRLARGRTVRVPLEPTDGRTPSHCPLAWPWKGRRVARARGSSRHGGPDRGEGEPSRAAPLAPRPAAGLRCPRLCPERGGPFGDSDQRRYTHSKVLEARRQQEHPPNLFGVPERQKMSRRNLRPTSSPQGAESAERPPDASALSSSHEEFRRPRLCPSSVKSPSGTPRRAS